MPTGHGSSNEDLDFSSERPAGAVLPLRLVMQSPAQASLAALDAPVYAPLGSERLEWVLNAAIALAALVVLAPLMLLIAVAVKLSSPGPVLYKQVRVGLDARSRPCGDPRPRRHGDVGGRLFTILKFRTMVHDAENGTGPVWASKADPRVTRVGRVLRKARLDELPQLINVVRGEMNIVGPRPERPDLFLEICGKLPAFQLRQATKPGITGWAQINQSYDTCINSVQRKLEYDLEYIRTKSFAGDLRIMLHTVPVMLFGEMGW